MRLDLSSIPTNKRAEAKQEIGKIIVDGIQEMLDQSTSPVSGGIYRKNKVDGDRSILFEDGDMRDAITFKSRPGNTIEVGIFKSSETPKAYGHTTGFKGHPNESKLRKYTREFIPGEEGTFKGKIMERVQKTIADFSSGGNNERDETSTEQTDRITRQTLGQLLGDDFEF